jgi:hypothetical protein
MFEVRGLYITNKKESAHIRARLIESSCGEAEVEITSGLDYIHSKLPPWFETGSMFVLQNEVWLDQFRLLVERAGEDSGSFWSCDCWGFDVTLESHELEWFN